MTLAGSIGLQERVAPQRPNLAELERKAQGDQMNAAQAIKQEQAASTQGVAAKSEGIHPVHIPDAEKVLDNFYERTRELRAEDPLSYQNRQEFKELQAQTYSDLDMLANSSKNISAAIETRAKDPDKFLPDEFSTAVSEGRFAEAREALDGRDAPYYEDAPTPKIDFTELAENYGKKAGEVEDLGDLKRVNMDYYKKIKNKSPDEIAYKTLAFVDYAQNQKTIDRNLDNASLVIKGPEDYANYMWELRKRGRTEDVARSGERSTFNIELGRKGKESYHRGLLREFAHTSRSVSGIRDENGERIALATDDLYNIMRASPAGEGISGMLFPNKSTLAFTTGNLANINGSERKSSRAINELSIVISTPDGSTQQVPLRDVLLDDFAEANEIEVLANSVGLSYVDQENKVLSAREFEAMSPSEQDHYLANDENIRFHTEYNFSGKGYRTTGEAASGMSTRDRYSPGEGRQEAAPVQEDAAKVDPRKKQKALYEMQDGRLVFQGPETEEEMQVLELLDMGKLEAFEIGGTAMSVLPVSQIKLISVSGTTQADQQMMDAFTKTKKPYMPSGRNNQKTYNAD